MYICGERERERERERATEIFSVMLLLCGCRDAILGLAERVAHYHYYHE